MEKTNLKIQFIEILEKHDWPTLCNLLVEQFKINPNDANSLDISSDVIANLSDLLDALKRLFLESKSNDYYVIKCIFKALRNSVAFNTTAQTLVSDNPIILNDTLKLLQALKQKEDDNGVACLRMLLQFLINLVVNNTLSSNKVWYLFQNDLKELMKNDAYLYHTSALIYNIFHNDIRLFEEDSDIILYIFDSYTQNNSNEYLTFLLELFVKNEHLNKTYIHYKAQHRMLCLEMMKELINDNLTLMTEELIEILSHQFKEKSDCILKTVTDYLKDIEPFEVILLLELLASISSNETLVIYLQKDRSLLINCAFLLKGIHSISKQSDNNFSVIPKLSQCDKTDIEMLQHPSYGFKAAIVRLLANLCWKHRSNQDEMRELDCIPLLLDCCNIDARNPFIIQWVVFAIRNLCENNKTNQAIIASMNKEGVVSSAALHEMGITLQSNEEHTIKIVPLDFNK